MRIKNVQHSLKILGFASRSTPSLHLHFIIHPVLVILCFSDVKRVISFIIPVAFIAYLSIEALTYLCEPCTVLSELFDHVLVGTVTDSYRLFILCSPAKSHECDVC